MCRVIAVLAVAFSLGCQGFKSGNGGDGNQGTQGYEGSCTVVDKTFDLRWIPYQDYDPNRYAYTGFEVMYGPQAGVHTNSVMVAPEQNNYTMQEALSAKQEYFFVIRAAYSDNQFPGQIFYTDKSNEICKYTKNNINLRARVRRLEGGQSVFEIRGELLSLKVTKRHEAFGIFVPQGQARSRYAAFQRQRRFWLELGIR